MDRRAYLSTIGIVTGTALAGCSGETGSNNSSGGESNSSGGSGGGESSEANGSEETAISTSSGESEDTAANGSSATEMDEDSGNESEATDTESDSSNSGEDSDSSTESSNSSEDSDNDSDSDGSSSSISDSGDTDVSIKSADIGDQYSLDSAEYYSSDMGNGVRGELTNTTDSSISYTGINVKFYDDSDTRLGEALDNTTDLGGGESYAYDAIGTLMPDKAEQVTSYTIEVTNSPM